MKSTDDTSAADRGSALTEWLGAGSEARKCGAWGVCHNMAKTVFHVVRTLYGADGRSSGVEWLRNDAGKKRVFRAETSAADVARFLNESA